MAGNALIGAVTMALGADTAAFEVGLKDANKTLKSSFGLMKSAAIGFAAGIGAELGGAALSAVKDLAAGALESATEIKKMSSVANTGFVEFQKMAVGAKSVGIEQEKLSDILKDVNDRVGDFLTTGGGPMADFFEKVAPKVGVTAQQFKNLSGKDALQLYVSSLEKAGLNQQEMTFYMEAMASDATALIPLLKDGGAGMTAMGEAAQKSGQIMSQELVDKLVKADTAINKTKDSLQTMAKVAFGEAIVATMDFLEQQSPLIDSITETAKQVGQFLKPSIDNLQAAFTNFVNSEGGKMLGSLLLNVGKILGGFVVVNFKLAVNGATILLKAFTSLTNYISQMVDKIKVAFDRLKPIMQPVIDMAGKVSHAFGKMEDEVTGHSYVPDMVDEIERQFARLNGNMVKPSLEATKAVDEAFKGLLESLMTDSERLQSEYIANLKIINDELKLHPKRIDATTEAMKRLNAEYAKSLSGVMADKIGQGADITIGNQAVISAKEEEKLQKTIDTMGGIIAANDNMRKAFSETFSDGIIEALNGGDIGKVFTDRLRNWAVQGLQKSLDDLFGSVYDILSGGKSGGGIGGIFNTISSIFSGSPKFATGGSVGIKGGGGTDSRLFSAWVSPNEIIDIRRPDQMNNNGGQSQINIHLGNELLDSRIVDISQAQSIQVTGTGMVAQRQAQYKQAAFRVRR